MEKPKEDFIPEQEQGSKMDAVETRNFNTLVEAEELFTVAADRLRSVNQWAAYSGISEFKLFDSGGDHVSRKAEIGDYIRIDIPGPGTAAGGGFDWVHIEDIQTEQTETSNQIAMRVRPCSNPLNDHAEVAHFLKSDATSTFIVKRTGTLVSAEEHGRNEMPNAGEGSLADRSRNVLVGIAAKVGFSYPQWKLLVKGLLEPASS